MNSVNPGWFASLRFMPSPDARPQLTPVGVLACLLPAYLGYYTMAVLVLLPRTRQYRLSLLPIALWLAFRAATTYNLNGGNPKMNAANYGICVSTAARYLRTSVSDSCCVRLQLSMGAVAMRLIEWSMLEEPLTRPNKAGGSSVYANALDLALNFRGIGWKWGENTYIPPETRPTHSQSAFLFATLARLLKSLLLFDVFNYTVIKLAPPGVGTTSGGSIFDPSLPPIPRYALSTLITLIYGGVFFFSLDLVYYFTNTLAVALLNQPPSSWPTFSLGPWHATSLSMLWGKCWHQSFRRSFLALSTPLYMLFGRAGSVAGAFLLSAVLHDWSIWGMGRGTNFAQTGGFFLLMSVGIVLESAWERITARKVGGWGGWVWTMVWMLMCGNLLIDAWMRTGLGGCDLIPPETRPVKLLLDYLLPKIFTQRS